MAAPDFGQALAPVFSMREKTYRDNETSCENDHRAAKKDNL